MPASCGAECLSRTAGSLATALAFVTAPTAVGAAATGATPCSGCPQELQNFWLGSFSAAHCGHARTPVREAPHSPQKRALPATS